MRFPLHVLAGVVCLLLAPLCHATESDEPGEAVKPPKKDAAAGTTSVTQNVQGQSGITIQAMCTNCNSADLSVGSFSNEFISMTCDGLPVTPGLAQIYLLSVVPPSTIENVAVEKGAGSAAVSGGAIGGEIEIERRPIEEGWGLNASIDRGEFGWNGTRLDLSGKKKWFGAHVIASIAESDSIDEDGDTNPEVGAIDRETIEGRFDFELGKKSTLKVGISDYTETQSDARAAYDSISSSIEGRPLWNREAVELDRTQYDATLKSRFRGNNSLTATFLQAQRDTSIEETRLIFVGTFLPSYDIGEINRHAAVTWEKQIGTGGGIRAGLSRNEADFSITDFTALSGLPEGDNEVLTENGVWAETKFDFPGRWSLAAGLRWVEFDYTDTEDNPQFLAYDLPTGSRLLPRAALSWNPAEPVNLRLSYGLGLRQPPPAFEEVCCGRRYRGNRGIRTEDSRTLGFEVTWEPNADVKLGASLFRTSFDDMIVKMVTQSFQYRPQYQNVNIPDARLENVSIDGTFDPAHWVSLKASANWTAADNRTPGGEIPALIDFFFTPTEVSYFSTEIPYIPERTLSVSAQFRWLKPQLTFDLSWQHSGSMTIQSWDPFVFDPVTGGDTLAFIETSDFNVANVRVTQGLPIGLDVFFGVDNLTDYVQDDIASPNTDYTWGPLRGRYYYVGVSFRYAVRR